MPPTEGRFLTTDCAAWVVFTWTGGQAGNWRVRMRVGDNELFSRSFMISAPPSSLLTPITDTTLPKATLGATYSFNLQVSGGTTPYRWSISDGTLPPGLSLSAGGNVTGAPTRTGSYLLILHLADFGVAAEYA